MKTDFIKNNKQKIKDLAMSITATAVMNIVIQFLMYPYLERVQGKEAYGATLSVLSIVAIISCTLGTAANYSRIVMSTKSVSFKNGDYNIILLLLSLICGAGGIFYVRYLGERGATAALLFVLLIVFTALRYYSDVEYKINGNFFRYMLFYIAVSVGYIAGMFVYSLTGEWMLAFIVGEALSIIFVIFKGTIYRRDLLRPSGSFPLVAKSMGFLLLSVLIENLTLNADRLLLMVIEGGAAVTIYYTASLLGKIVAMLSVPLNSLIISYLVKYEGGLTKKLWSYATLGICALGVLAFGGCTLVSPLVLGILYPDLRGDIAPYIAPAILGQIFYFISGILLVVLLKFRGEKKQFLFNLGYAVEFLAIVLAGTLLFGLDGFVYSCLAANAIRFIAVIIWGFVSILRTPAEAK
ncbi:MAG: hypothetical protein E7641_02950 [Ruminococcaceae bacterium]|nr:hypothetical protein [Oscillospiraceae bacterium]